MKPPDELRFRKQCQARDAESGKRCSLLEQHAGEHNASGRAFTYALRSGAEPRRELDFFAARQLGTAIETGSDKRELTRNAVAPPAPFDQQQADANAIAVADSLSSESAA